MFDDRALESALRTAFFLTLSVCALCWPARPAFAHEGVPSIVPVSAEGIHRGYGAVGERPILELQVPAARIVFLDLIHTGPWSAEPLLGLPRTADGLPTVELWFRTPERLVFVAESPTIVRVALATPDGVALGAYRIQTGWVELGPADKSDDEEVEEDPDEIELDPNPLSSEGILGPCVAQDDHGDTLGCASPLRVGSVTRATLGNGWGDDVDVFAIDLPARRGSEDLTLHTLEIESTGPTDTFGVLYDARGLRLGHDGAGGGGENFRLVRHLPPGRYFLRVGGEQGAGGPYGLRLLATTP